MITFANQDRDYIYSGSFSLGMDNTQVSKFANSDQREGLRLKAKKRQKVK